MLKNIKKYMFLILTSLTILMMLMINNELGTKAIDIIGYSLKEMLLIIPPIFILLGLLDVWVPREIMIKYMGEESGVTGVILSIILGSAAAGPLYAAFPIAGVFMKKGVKFSNVLIFIGAWSTTKIPMFLFELSSLGSKFALTRLLVDIPGIIIIGSIISKSINTTQLEEIYIKAQSRD